MELLTMFDFKFDMIFADPPYFLSNDGISVQSGKIVSVNKGDWDKGGTLESINQFNSQWIKSCRDKLKDNGTIWVSGTYHNIFSVATALQQLGQRQIRRQTSRAASSRTAQSSLFGQGSAKQSPIITTMNS